MKITTLTQKQKETRKKGIGGTDAKLIMEGNWTDLWAEKIGKKEPDDLSKNFKVHLGINTEEFNLDWLAATTNWNVIKPKPNQTFFHKTHKHMLCHPDAWATIDGIETTIDAKHLSPHAPWNNSEIVMKRYYWQAQHNMTVMGTKQFVLSCIWGNEWQEPLFIKANQNDIDVLTERETEFWWHVQNKKEPYAIEQAQAPDIPIDDMKIIDMKGNNEWSTHAASFLENIDSSKKFDQSKKELKTKIETNVKHAFGYGVEGVRAKNGNITIRKIKE